MTARCQAERAELPMHQTSDELPPESDPHWIAGEPLELTIAGSLRLLATLETSELDEHGISAAITLRCRVMEMTADAGDVTQFESQCIAIRGLLRRARLQPASGRPSRKALAAEITRRRLHATVQLCARGGVPRFSLVRQALELVLAESRVVRVGSDSVRSPSDSSVETMIRTAAAQCVGGGSRRRARRLACVLEGHLRALTDTPMPSPGCLYAVNDAIAAIVGRFGVVDSSVARATVLTAFRMLPHSASVAAEGVDVLVNQRQRLAVRREVRLLAHAIASEAWLALGDDREAARHAVACRLAGAGRMARRWHEVPEAHRLIERVDATGIRSD